MENIINGLELNFYYHDFIKRNNSVHIVSRQQLYAKCNHFNKKTFKVNIFMSFLKSIKCDLIFEIKNQDKITKIVNNKNIQNFLSNELNKLNLTYYHFLEHKGLKGIYKLIKMDKFDNGNYNISSLYSLFAEINYELDVYIKPKQCKKSNIEG